MKRFLLLALLLLVPTIGWAQGNTNTLPPACTVANIATCVPQVEGTIVRMTLGASATDCTTDGGSTVAVCQYDGSAWIPSASVSGAWTGANGETITNGTDGTITFTRDTDATVTLMAADSATPANLTIDTTAAGIITIGSADVASMTLNTNGQIVVGATTSDGVVITSDGLILDVGYVSGNTTAALKNAATGSVTLDFRDYADTTDDDMAHARLVANCTTASTGAEDCDLVISTTEAGANGTRLTIDGDGDTTFAPEPADGGSGDGIAANLQHRINGIPKIAPFSINPGTVNTNTLNTDFQDGTPAGEWTATTNVVDATEATIIRMVAGSLSLTYDANVVAGNGADNPLGSGDQDWSADESFGLWHRCDFTYDAGDLVLGVTDNASEDATTTFPAYGTANTWVWTELEIGSIADADKNIITDISIDLSTAGAVTAAAAATAGSAVCYFDYMWKWDAAEEMALGLDIYEDGILSVMSIIKATGGDRIPIIEVEGTDYFVHYEAGVDFLVPITALNSDVLWGMAALE